MQSKVQVLGQKIYATFNCGGCERLDSLIWQGLDGIHWVGSFN